MKTVGLLLGEMTPPDGLPSPDRVISLSPPTDLNTQPPGLIDGEQAYGLHSLTERADDLAMKWARAVAARIEADPRWRPLMTYDQMNLHPLLVNRLFRGFFIRHARTYLSVWHILDVERPQQVRLYTTSGAVAGFASAACHAFELPPDVICLPGQTPSRLPIPPALNTLAREIVAPALRHALPAPPRRHANLPHIVFVERGVLHAEIVARALDALRKLCEVQITIVRFFPAPPTLVYPHARYTDMDSYQDISTLVHLLAFQTRVMTTRGLSVPWPKALPQSSLPSTLRFVKQVALPSIVHTLELVRRIIQIEQPNLLLTIDETGLLGKAAALQGLRLSVPTLNVQHGVRTDSPWAEDQLFDRFATFGPSSKETFVKRGNDPSIFIPTGAPRYDRIFRREGIKSRQQVAVELGLDPGQPIITFTSQRAWGRMTPIVKRETLLALLRAWHQTDAQLVVKLRHGQPDYVPPEASREPGWNEVKVTADYDLYDLFNASDVVVTAYSTAGMEAVAMGKPLLIINLTGQPDPIPYVQEGVAVGAYQPDQVAPALLHLLSTGRPDPNWLQCRRGFIRRHLTSDDGRSADRLAQLMLEMMGN